MIEAYSIAQAT